MNKGLKRHDNCGNDCADNTHIVCNDKEGKKPQAPVNTDHEIFRREQKLTEKGNASWRQVIKSVGLADPLPSDQAATKTTEAIGAGFMKYPRENLLLIQERDPTEAPTQHQKKPVSSHLRSETI